MNKKQKWKNIQNKFEGFILDMRFDFDKLSEYGFEINEVCANFEAHQGHMHEQIFIYKSIRRPRWVYMPKINEKRSIAIIRRMYEDGILEPMKWENYIGWRKLYLTVNGILE